MSSSGSSSSSTTSQYYQGPDLSFEDGLIIAVGVLGFLIILVLLRFFCNCFIDVTLLGETGSLTQCCGQLWRCLCPWWRPRTNPEDPSPSGDDIELQQQVDVARTGMSADEWKTLIHSILPSKKVEAEDLASWKDAQGCSAVDAGSSSEDCDEHNNHIDQCTGIVCSICLHDLEIGDAAVISTSCQHVFHNECIISWLQRNLACPYCRVDMISLEQLQTAIRRSQDES